MLGVFAKTKIVDVNGGEAGLPPKRHVREFRVLDENGLLPVGRTIDAEWFQVGQFVDAQSNNKGKGFAGVSVKDHWWEGGLGLMQGVGYETLGLPWSTCLAWCFPHA